MADAAAPLFALMKKGVQYSWTEECQKAFDEIKIRLTTAPVLGTPNLEKGPFILTCDASLFGLGAVLAQEQDGKEVTLAYWSKTLNPAQRNYCATHRELLALVESIKAFHHYLAGAPCTVRSDHAALQWLRTFKNPTGKLARWLERLAPYKFQVVYEKGTNIGHADALSRRPDRPCKPVCKKCDTLETRDDKEAEILRVKTDSGFQIIRINEDILKSPKEMPLVHAVSHDGHFGKGLAEQVERKYQVRQEFLKDKRRGCPGMSVIHTSERTIINLVTKMKYYHKPYPEEVAHTLYLLCAWMKLHKIREVCMPAIACGLDRLKISDVLKMIIEEFKDTDFTIYMYHFQETEFGTALAKRCVPECRLCVLED